MLNFTPGILEIEKTPDEFPQPPEAICDDDDPKGIFLPAPEMMKWIRTHFIDYGGAFTNPHHEHLQQAMIGLLLTDEGESFQGARVVGMAEQPRIKPGWKTGRSGFMMRRWWGEVPDFIITLDAPYLHAASWQRIGALIDHELYHCGQKMLGQVPLFSKKTGLPFFAMRPHDVEEFVGVPQRWGLDACAGKAKQFVEAALKAPKFTYEYTEAACCACGAAR